VTGSVLIAQQDGIRTLTPNRPEALNAFTVESTRELQCFATKDFAEGVRALVERRPPRFTGE